MVDYSNLGGKRRELMERSQWMEEFTDGLNSMDGRTYWMEIIQIMDTDVQ